VSVKIFGITEEVRDIYIQKYVKYCRDMHVIQYIEWRRKNRGFQKHAPPNRKFLDD
jgi:hypothetical protein